MRFFGRLLYRLDCITLSNGTYEGRISRKVEPRGSFCKSRMAIKPCFGRRTKLSNIVLQVNLWERIVYHIDYVYLWTVGHMWCFMCAVQLCRMIVNWRASCVDVLIVHTHTAPYPSPQFHSDSLASMQSWLNIVLVAGHSCVTSIEFGCCLATTWQFETTERFKFFYHHASRSSVYIIWCI